MKVRYSGKLPAVIRTKDLTVDIYLKTEVTDVLDELGEKLLKIKGFEKA